MLSGKLVGDPNFASVEVTRKRDRIIVYWHGAPSRELLDTIESRPFVPVEIRPTKVASSMLKGKAASLARNDATVGSVELKPDGSGLLKCHLMQHPYRRPIPDSSMSTTT